MNLSRRATFVGIAALAAAGPAWAEAADLDRVIGEITKGAGARSGRVKLTLPELAENGNVVSLLVQVDSPMTAQDHVRAITVLAEKNPITMVARFHLGPRAGRARVGSNIRLAISQRVVAVAEMSDGSFWQGEQGVVVTLAACVNGG